MLKASEGLGRFVKVVLNAEFRSNILNMLGAVIARTALKTIAKRLNPSRYNGASLLGLRGLVFKSHGGADAYGYEWAIRRAFEAAKLDVLSRISTAIAALMLQDEAVAQVHTLNLSSVTTNDLSEPKNAA